MAWPRISIVTPSFNQGRFLESTLRSVLEQNYPNLQYGVVDGGSTDESNNIIERYRSQLDFVIIEPDRGQSEAINKGLRRCDGQIVAWLNSDDTLLPGALHAVARHFDAHPDAHWLIGRCRAIDADGKPVRTLTPEGDFTLYGLLRRRRPVQMPQPSTFWRRALLDRAGLLDESLHHCMDFDLWCRFALHGYRPKLLEDELATYRFHSDSKTCTQRDSFIRALIEIEGRYLRHLPWRGRFGVRRVMGYQRRALMVASAARRPWEQVLRRPWWLASQQVLGALWRGPGGQRSALSVPMADS